PLLARKGSRNACVTLNTPLRLIAMMSCQSLMTASGSAVNALRRLIPALLTRTETCPTSLATFAAGGPPGGPVGAVCGRGWRRAAVLADFRGRLGGRVAVDVERDDLCALAGVAERNRAADAGACAGYDRDMIVQKSWHCSFP